VLEIRDEMALVLVATGTRTSRPPQHTISHRQREGMLLGLVADTHFRDVEVVKIEALGSPKGICRPNVLAEIFAVCLSDET
jgi:hypothetical protein